MSRRVKGIFCHDLPIYKDIHGVYCSTTLTDNLFERYFCAIDELVVATRVYSLECSFKEAHQEPITLSNIRIIDLPNLNSIKNYLSKQAYVRNVLTKEISDADLVFIRGGMIALIGTDVVRKLKKPYLIECGGCAWEGYWYHSLRGKLIAPYMEYRERKDVKDASYVIYVTEKWLQKRYPTKAEYSTYASNVILTKVDKKVYEKRYKKITEKNDNDVIVLGTTAAVNNKAKGQQYVMEAISRLPDSMKIRYEMVGGGNTKYLELVAKKFNVRNKIIFKGQLNHDEVLNWLDSIDIYIQPSRQEGLPRSLIEAMSRACPAIGSRVAGIPELLQEDVIFKAGKVDQLKNILERMISGNLVEYAKYNFTKAGEYELEKLNERRKEIYTKYREEIIRE